jgi:ABC-type spermidine/putrescine transport system permease subunit I
MDWPGKSYLMDRTGGRLLLLPIGIVLLIFMTCVALVVANSFRLDSTQAFSVQNYRLLFDGYFLARLWVSFKLSAFASVICLFLGYPLSLIIAFGRERLARIILFLVTVVFFSDYVMRMYALILIFGNAGIINRSILALGLSAVPIKFLYSELGVTIGLVVGNLAYFVLSAYPSIARVPNTTLEAAATLGAKPRSILFGIVVPQSSSGIGAGFVIVFLMCLNSYITPALLGGGFVPMVANVVYDQAINTWRPNLASASAVILLLVSCLTLLAAMLLVRHGRR